jgi:hypothetical protein
MSEFIEQTVCKTSDLQNNELVLLLVKDLVKINDRQELKI